MSSAPVLDRQDATIRRDGHVISVDDEILRRIVGIDRNHEGAARSNGSRRQQNVFENLRSLIRPICPMLIGRAGFDSPRLPTPSLGLLPVLRQLARHQGIELSVPGTTLFHQLPPPVNRESLQFPQLADFVHENIHGTISLPKWCKPEDVIHDTCLAFPDEKLAVLGTHRGQLRRIAGELQRRGVDAVAISGREPLIVPDGEYDDEQEPRVICSTPTAIADSCFPHKQIVFVLDAYKCGQDLMRTALLQIDARFRLFGLVPAERRPARSEEAAAFAAFGPARLELNGIRQARRDVRVTWIDSPPPKNDLEPTDSEFPWKTYWHQPRRNLRIKQLVEALQTGQALDRRNFGDLAKIYGGDGYRRPFVVILVERPLHAAALSKMLLDWPVVISDTAMQGLPGSFRNRVKQHRKNWSIGPGYIVLADSADRFCGDSIDVVVWAGGGQSTEAIPRNWLFAEYGHEKPLLIVDFQDQHNPHARRFSRQRGREYAERFISPVHQTLAEARIECFIRQLDPPPRAEESHE